MGRLMMLLLMGGLLSACSSSDRLMPLPLRQKLLMILLKALFNVKK
jgi:hypothetical protein